MQRHVATAMRLLFFYVAIATCLLVMVGPAYGHKTPHKKGKMCYQCAWSPPTLTYATVKKAQHSTHLSGYGQPTHTGLYHSTKKVPVRVEGGWDKCYDRFSRQQADLFGIDQWECEHNCYTRSDKNGNIYRGCYKGEFNVNPNKLGCHMQAGSRYCFCSGELCNYEQGQSYDGFTNMPYAKKLNNRVVVKAKKGTFLKSTAYNYKPDYLHRYAIHPSKSNHGKPYSNSNYVKLDKYGYYVTFDNFIKPIVNYDEDDMKYVHDNKLDSRENDYGYGYGYGNSIASNVYTSGGRAKNTELGRKTDVYENHGHKYKKPLVHQRKSHRHRDVLKPKYDEYDYGKLGYIIHEKPVWSYSLNSLSENRVAPSKYYRHKQNENYVHRKHMGSKHLSPWTKRKFVYMKVGPHKTKAGLRYWKAYNPDNYIHQRYKSKSINNRRPFGNDLKKLSSNIHKSEHKLHNQVYDNYKRRYGPGSVYKDIPSHKSTSGYGDPYTPYTPPFAKVTIKPNYDDYDDVLSSFDYDIKKPIFDYDIDRPLFGYDTLFGYKHIEKPEQKYNSRQQEFKLYNSHKLGQYEQRHFFPEGRNVQANIKYANEALDDSPSGSSNNTVHVDGTNSNHIKTQFIKDTEK